MLSWIYIHTTGLWPLVEHYSFAAISIAACLAYAYFSPVGKKTALWAAGVILVGTICYGVGVSNGEHHIRAQWKAAEGVAINRGEKARSDAESAVDALPAGSVPNDRYDRNDQ